MSAFSAARQRLVTGLLLGSTTLLTPAAVFAQDAPLQETEAVNPLDAEAAEEAVPTSDAGAPVSPDASAAEADPEASVAATDPNNAGRVRSITVRGNERLEAETVASYVGLSAGEAYDRNRLDEALKALYATDLFADVIILGSDTGNLIVQVQENPVVNRIVLEGNERVKEDKISPEIRLAPRQIFTRAKARSDVARIVELYRRQGRFAASVEPLIVPLDQNRVDVVFEIQEGPKSKVRRINFLGNTEFSDGKLRGEIATREAKWYRLFTSNDTYDPDRSAYDQQVLRQFYLTEGYADFRVASSVAELTPDNEDFVLTYVIEEGQKYNFGEVALESEIRDIDEENFRNLISIQEGDDYNAKRIEDTITVLQETAGLLGYAFADVQPQFVRNRESLTMDVTFVVREAPRVYVERVDINGNVITRDKVVRREFRLLEGDAFNTFKVQRSQARIQSLGFFQEGLEIEQKPGSGPDKVILEVNAQEQATGELQLSAGFSSLERFLVSASIRQRNFRGLGQELRASANLSSYSRSVDVGFTEPYLFNRNLALGFDVFRRDFNNFRFDGSGNRDTTYEQVSTGFQLRTGFPITEFWSASLRYNLQLDDIFLDEGAFFTDPDGASGPLEPVCDPLRAGRFLCDAIGKRTTSALGYSIAFDNTDNRIRPTRGQRVVFSQDVAGLGGVKYIRTGLDADKYFRFGRTNFVLGVGVEGGYIRGFGGDDIRINDRYFLGEPRMRGFDIRGVGPRVIRTRYVTGTEDGPNAVNIGDIDFDGEDDFVELGQEGNARQDDAIGGQAYYLARAELQIPLGEGVAELGIRPSIFVDAGALFDVDFDPVNDITPIFSQEQTFTNPDDEDDTLTTDVPVFREEFFGDSAKPRVSVGIGASWNSPFGPFRFDIAKALVKEPGDDTQVFQFNVGTSF
jgi:outer membrane protein insertion porin family|tara:strand:- start:76060 stop:78807 length:2748 start_codon:yes stop_codon:yes gene_type:complete